MASETLSFETADGLTLMLSNDVFVYEKFPDNFGAPPTNYVVRSGYKQDGATEIAFFLQPRDFEIDFWRQPACDRTEYWENRAALLEIFRPNRGGQLTFAVNREDGSRRALKVRAQPGPAFTSQRTNDFNVRETLAFTAFDPVWFDPTQTAMVISPSVSNDLVFPITFPIQFGASGVLFTQSITYTGTWKTFPTLKFTGPYTSVTLANQATGYQIFMTVPILAGETRTLDLTPGNQSLVDQNGDDAFGDLGPLSNLVNFALLPDPEVAGGIQTIQAIFYGGTNGVSAFEIDYFTKYIGI